MLMDTRSQNDNDKHTGTFTDSKACKSTVERHGRWRCRVIVLHVLCEFCRWYMKKFEDYPVSRRALIPFVL